MKIKKIFVLIITLILATCLVGCGNQNTEKAVANNLSRNADRLQSVIQSLEEIENEDITIDGLSPIDSTYTAKSSSKNYSTQNTTGKKYQFGKHILKALELDMPTIEKPKHDPNARYVNGEKIGLNEQNTENNEQGDKNVEFCENGICYTKNCENGDCHIVNKNDSNANNNTTQNNNTQNKTINSKNEQKTRKKPENVNKNGVKSVKNTANNTKQSKGGNKKNNVTSTNTNNKSTKNTNNLSKKGAQNNAKNSVVKNNTNKSYSTNKVNNTNKSYSANKVNNVNQSYSNQNNQKTQNNNQVKTYKPKYVNEVSENFNRNQLDKYLQNVEGVYNSCADCISCNEQCKIEQAKLEQNLKDCKVYCSKLKDGTISLSQEEIAKCNQTMQSLSNCIDRLNSTKGNANLKTNDILKMKDAFGNNVTSLTDAYNKLCQTLESRLEYLKECNNNLNCIFDIINKTNVNMAEAEQNKSNENEIIKNEERLKEEEELNADNYYNFNNEQNFDYNYNNQNEIDNNTNSSNMGASMAPAANKTTADYLTNQNTKTMAYNEEYQNQNNLPEKHNRIINVEESSELNNNVNENNTDVNRTNNIDTYQNANTQKNGQTTQNVLPNGDQTINSTANLPPQPVLNNSAINNGYNYPYGYNGPILPYGTNNMPYPPRNIDTYRYITKNIDTYAPNYVPNPLQNNTNGVTQNTQTQNNISTDQNKNDTETENIDNSTNNNLENNENNI